MARPTTDLLRSIILGPCFWIGMCYVRGWRYITPGSLLSPIFYPLPFLFLSRYLRPRSRCSAPSRMVSNESTPGLVLASSSSFVAACTSSAMGNNLPRTSLPGERNSANSPESVDNGNCASLTSEFHLSFDDSDVVTCLLFKFLVVIYNFISVSITNFLVGKVSI